MLVPDSLVPNILVPDFLVPNFLVPDIEQHCKLHITHLQCLFCTKMLKKDDYSKEVKYIITSVRCQAFESLQGHVPFAKLERV